MVKGTILLGAGLLFAGTVLGQVPFQRVPNTTLHFPSAPPSFGYGLTNAFGNLTFSAPVGMTSPPGETNRLFVIEQGGRIIVITNLTSPNRSVFLDLSSRILGGIPPDERGLLGLAFHPGYRTNGFFFVYYVGTATTAVPGGTNAMHDILARFQVSASNPNAADPGSESRLITQYDQASNHNAGDLHFGPDGYLYLSLGDEGGGNDQYNNSQRIDKDYFSGILRLDVDRRAGNISPNPHPSVVGNYLVPADNPFIGATSFNGQAVNPANVRTEFWAVGLRNPWRFSFDSIGGTLYCADVGQDAYEEIDIITRGGNYGWAYREGLHAGPKSPPPGFTSLDPIQEYSHGYSSTQGYAVTGGVVYRGNRLTQLAGAYVFADYASGNIWVLRYQVTNTVPFQRIAGETGIAGFGVDPRNGDILMANQNLSTIRRLISTSTTQGFPQTLADTGAFTDLGSLAPAPGIVPYDVNLPFWSDNASKTRWFSIPNTNLTISFAPALNWSFPTGSVWVKHFELELTNGVPESNRRLETRFVIKNSSGVYGVTYRWDPSGANAALVPPEGLDEPLLVNDGGVVRTQVWHYPSWSECQACHTAVGGYALGFNTPQLNRNFDYGQVAANQLEALSDAGYFSSAVTGLHTLRALAPADDTSISREFRVRSFLAANCVQCHQPGGTGQSFWDARITTPTAQAGLINGPVVNNLGSGSSRVIAPGSLGDSILYRRLSEMSSIHMPPLGTTVPNAQAINLVSDWITTDLIGYETFSDWQVQFFGSTNTAAADASADPDGDGASNYLEYLTRTDPTDSLSAWSIQIQRSERGIEIQFPRLANLGFEVQAATNLLAPAWKPLDVPGNEPLFWSFDQVSRVPDISTNSTQKFYRVRVFPP